MTDAHSIALVGTRVAGLRPVVSNADLDVLRLLADRRRQLGDEHTRKVSQLHALLLELIPSGAKKNLSASQAKQLLAKVRPREVAGKTRRRLAAELIADLERIHTRKKAADKELRELVAATGTRLMDLHGIGPSGAARLLVEVGDRWSQWVSATLPDSRRLRWRVVIGGFRLRMRMRSGRGCALGMRLSRQLVRWASQPGRCGRIWCGVVGSGQLRAAVAWAVEIGGTGGDLPWAGGRRLVTCDRGRAGSCSVDDQS